MKDIYAVLDLGSSTIKLVVGEIVNSNVNILYASMIPSHGIKNGEIKNQSLVIEDIRQIIASGQSALNTKIERVALNIPTHKSRLYQCQGSCMVHRPQDGITNEDIIRALNDAKRFERKENEEIISVIPVTYYYSQTSSKEAPIGKKSANLTIDAMVITTRSKILYPYLRVVELSGLEVVDISIDAYGCAKEAFDEVYLEEGAILIDIGYKSSSISFFYEGYLQLLTTVPVGGYSLTKKLANELQIPIPKAEAYKIKYGTCNRQIGNEDIIHTIYMGDEEKNYSQRDLAELLYDAAKEMAQVIKEKISVIEGSSKYEMLIVGGGGELEDIAKPMMEVLGSSVRVYRPEIIGARKMSYVSCLGMIYFLNDRIKILGKQKPSLVLPELTHTMSLRFKGLTKSTGQKSDKKINKLIDAIFTENE